MSIDPAKVNQIFKDSLSKDGAVVDGITARYGLDVSGKEEEIGDILAELPDEFQSTKGGGWSFLNACNDRDGNQWTGQHSVMEELFCLGIAAGKAKYLMPREMWSVLPGGVPYIVVN